MHVPAAFVGGLSESFPLGRAGGSARLGNLAISSSRLGMCILGPCERMRPVWSSPFAGCSVVLPFSTGRLIGHPVERSPCAPSSVVRGEGSTVGPAGRAVRAFVQLILPPCLLVPPGAPVHSLVCVGSWVRSPVSWRSTRPNGLVVVRGSGGDCGDCGRLPDRSIAAASGNHRW